MKISTKNAAAIRAGINDARAQAARGDVGIAIPDVFPGLKTRAYLRISERYRPAPKPRKLAPIPKAGEHRPDLVKKLQPPKGPSGISTISPTPTRPNVDDLLKNKYGDVGYHR